MGCGFNMPPLQNKNFTALMYACDAGREEVVRMLLSRNPKPNCLSTNKVCLIWNYGMYIGVKYIAFFKSSTGWQPCIWLVIMVIWESSKWWLHPRDHLEWILMSTTRDFEMVEGFLLSLPSLIVVSSRSWCWEGQRWDSNTLYTTLQSSCDLARKVTVHQ